MTSTHPEYADAYQANPYDSDARTCSRCHTPIRTEYRVWDSETETHRTRDHVHAPDDCIAALADRVAYLERRSEERDSPWR